MDKRLFLSLLNNLVLKNLIFEHVYSYKPVNRFGNINNNENCRKYRWADLISMNHLEALAGNGHIDILKQYFFVKKTAPLSPLPGIVVENTYQILRNAIYFGDLNQLIFLMAHLPQDYSGNDYVRPDLMGHASRAGNLQIAKHLGTLFNVKWDYNSAMVAAPFSGNLEVLKYFATKVDLQSRYNIWCHYSKSTAFDSAAEMGNLEMIEWLQVNVRKDRGASKMYASAVRGGHLHVLEYLIKRRALKDPHIFQYTRLYDLAAHSGNLPILQWLHENKIGDSAYAMDYAAGIGRLDIVQWLHKNRNERCSFRAMNYAAQAGSLEVIKWLHENSTQGCSPSAMDSAATIGSLEIVKWLHENRTEGCTAAAIDLAAYAHIDVVKFLHKNRTEGCTHHAMDNAAENGRLDIIQFLHDNRTEGCSIMAYDRAVLYKHTEVIKWLKDNLKKTDFKEVITKPSTPLAFPTKLPM